MSTNWSLRRLRHSVSRPTSSARARSTNGNNRSTGLSGFTSLIGARVAAPLAGTQPPLETPTPAVLSSAAMTNDEALQIFRRTGALLDGHFILRSGLHSRQFFQCALALQMMPVVEKFGRALAEQVRWLGVQTVVAPAMG